MKKNTYVSWSSAYSVGLSKIDEQHQKWLNILNNFHDAVQKGQGPLFVLKTLKEFHDYTEYHFSEEEKLFLKYNYPESEFHIKAHREMIWKITHLDNDFAKNKIITSIKTLETLKDWLIKHILSLDKEFGDYVAAVNKETGKTKTSCE
jgi:hemerythrin